MMKCATGRDRRNALQTWFDHGAGDLALPVTVSTHVALEPPLPGTAAKVDRSRRPALILGETFFDGVFEAGWLAGHAFHEPTVRVLQHVAQQLVTTGVLPDVNRE